MQSQSNDYSYFLTSERDLESLAENYFSTRPVEEQDDQEDNYEYDFSGDETDLEIDSDVDFDFIQVWYIWAIETADICDQTCGYVHGDNGTPCSSTIQIKDTVFTRV